MKAAHGLLPAVLLLVTVSCIPLPHRAFRTPVIVGVLTNGGNPTVGTALRVVAEPEPGSCQGRYTFEATSREDGSFALCPIPDFQFFVRVMAHRTFRWHVCAEDSGQWHVLHTGEQYTLVDSGPRLIFHLTCDIPSSSCVERDDVDISTSKALDALGDQRCKGISDQSQPAVGAGR